MRRHGIPILLIAAVLALSSPALQAQTSASPSEERLTAARTLMTAAGSIRQFDQFMPVMTAKLTQTFIALAPHAESHIREIMGQIVKRMADRKLEIVDQVAALYAAELTLDELRALTQFYESPVGAKFIAIQPVITQQTIIIGQKWGERIGREVHEEMRRELQKRGIKI